MGRYFVLLCFVLCGRLAVKAQCIEIVFVFMLVEYNCKINLLGLLPGFSVLCQYQLNLPPFVIFPIQYLTLSKNIKFVLTE